MKKNAREFQKIYIRPRSAVDSAQWDLGITMQSNCEDFYAMHV